MSNFDDARERYVRHCREWTEKFRVAKYAATMATDALRFHTSNIINLFEGGAGDFTNAARVIGEIRRRHCGAAINFVCREFTNEDFSLATDAYAAAFATSGNSKLRLVYTNGIFERTSQFLTGKGLPNNYQRIPIVLNGYGYADFQDELKHCIPEIAASNWSLISTSDGKGMKPATPTIVEITHRNDVSYWNSLRDRDSFELTAQGSKRITGYDAAFMLLGYQNSRPIQDQIGENGKIQPGKASYIKPIVEALAEHGTFICAHARGNNPGHSLTARIAEDAGFDFAETLFKQNHGGRIFETLRDLPGFDPEKFVWGGSNIIPYETQPYISNKNPSLISGLTPATLAGLFYHSQLTPEQELALTTSGRAEEITHAFLAEHGRHNFLSDELFAINRTRSEFRPRLSL